MTPAERLENERLRALATRNLLECCDYCRSLLREQLEREERGDYMESSDP